MIFDSIDHAEAYMGISQELDRALQKLPLFLDQYKSSGRIEGDGEALYANCMQYKLSCDSRKWWESHFNYIDIHVVIKGKELVQLAGKDSAVLEKSYDPAVEAEMYCAEPAASVELQEGSFVVFFPGEIHRAGMASEETEKVISKLVVKVLETHVS